LTTIQQLIIERIQQEGPITFAEYMRMALYEPGYGYYVTGPARMGWEEGDYYTSTDISSFFANCMGRQLYQFWQKLKCPAPFIVLEQGAGRGDLARGVRAWAEQDAPDFNLVLNYQTEDIRLGQDAKAPPGSAPCHEVAYPSIVVAPLVGAKDARDIGDRQAPHVILSNELVDAFPVHIVETRNKHLYEVYVDVEDGRLCEVLAEPSSPKVASNLDSYRIPWQSFGDGWRAEINLDALRWIEHTARLLRRHGFILTIDYGDKARALYTRYRERGTLTCYFQHHVNDQPLARPGRQDITAHINFSALIAEGRRHGLHLKTFTTQRLWLGGMGIYEELERRRASEFAAMDTERSSDRGQMALLRWYNLRQRVMALTDPAGMGNFKVLILRR
jgi:SAM-dependent MidA family methyltransferase